MENNNPPFKVGDEVICVEGTYRYSPFDEIMPTKGLKYHIREIEFHEEGHWAVRLVEIVNKKYGYMQGYSEVWFNASRFRKIPPAYVNVSKELAQEALKERIETDVPEKVIPSISVNQ